MSRGKSVPAKTAEKIEALGWTVERNIDGDRRWLTCKRDGSAPVMLVWHRQASGRDVFAPAVSTYPSVSEALKGMAVLDGAALDALDNDALVSAVAGKRVRYRNALTGKTAETVISGRRILIGFSGIGERTINFSDDCGFRSVRVSAIEEIA